MSKKEEDKLDVIQLTLCLLNIPSPSGQEKEIGLYLKKVLENENINVTLQEVDKRYNIFATIGEPGLLLTTHLDTVPGKLEIKEDNEYLYGRGACDTKGIIAAMIIAIINAKNEGYTNFALLLDVSEESDFSGIKEAINLVNPNNVIIGEPTNFQIVIAQKGLLGLTITTKGRAAAGSIPEQGDCAITKLCNILQKIKEIKLPFDQILGQTTLNIGTIKGGTAPNVVPESASATIEIRTTTSNEIVTQEIIKQINNVTNNTTVEINYSFEAASTPKNRKDPWAFLNTDNVVVPYFTEMYFWQKKAPTIVYGPGEYKYAHTNEERIKKIDLKKGVQKYFEIITTYCSKKNSKISTENRATPATSLKTTNPER